jgi:4-hydroxythreonine-4-phosphate dehydrogenase
MARAFAVSMGDPAGIGLEIAAKAWAHGGGPPFFLIGDADTLGRAAQRAGVTAPVEAIDDPLAAADCFARALPVMHRPLAVSETLGRPDPANADAIIGAIRDGVALCQSQSARGLVTLPIAKAALYRAGFAFPGHTEFLADLCGAARAVMMLAAPGLRVALATIHTPVREVAERLQSAEIVTVGRIVAAALQRDFSIARPRLAVAGLNPHAGEDGEIGREEIDVIAPAIAALQADGIAATGPHPADTMFAAHNRAHYDAALCMYHDQGLIPLKMLDFWGGVNITLGLPIVRTSPDHGVAYDIAGSGQARADSFIAALKAAAQIATARGL